MATVRLCWHFPCRIPVITSHHTATAAELALPFIVTMAIVLLSVVTSHEVVTRAEARFSENWGHDELARVEADRSPLTYALALPWVADAAQIPAVLGTPFVGLMILQSSYQITFITIYAVVALVFFLAFLMFLRKTSIYDYQEYGIRLAGYRVSPVAIGGVSLNAIAALLAVFVVK